MGPDGSVYVADIANQRIRRIGPDGIITTVAGNGTAGFSGDDGPATQAMLSQPFAVAVASDGSVFIADTDNHRIRRVGPDGIITTVAGNGTSGFSGDGGPALQATLGPFGVAVGPDGSIYIADATNGRIRQVGPDGIIATFAGNGRFEFSGDGGSATSGGIGLARRRCCGCRRNRVCRRNRNRCFHHRQQPGPSDPAGRHHHHGRRKWRRWLQGRWRRGHPGRARSPAGRRRGPERQPVYRRY